MTTVDSLTVFSIITLKKTCISDFAKALRMPTVIVKPASLRIYRNSTVRYATQWVLKYSTFGYYVIMGVILEICKESCNLSTKHFQLLLWCASTVGTILHVR